MKETKAQKGITLIALIITIIVLLILAVVTIGAIQNDGIILKAEDAKTRYSEEQEKEQIKLAEQEYFMEKTINADAPQTFKEYLDIKNPVWYDKANSTENTIVMINTGNQYPISMSGGDLELNNNEALTNEKFADVRNAYNTTGIDLTQYSKVKLSFKAPVSDTYFEMTFDSTGNGDYLYYSYGDNHDSGFSGQEIEIPFTDFTEGYGNFNSEERLYDAPYLCVTGEFEIGDCSVTLIK